MIIQQTILDIIKNLQQKYKKDGINILGIFGSYAKDTQTIHSDIDIAYSLDENIFFQKYKGFKSASKISEVKEELSKKLNNTIDLISINNSNKILASQIKKDLIYV